MLRPPGKERRIEFNQLRGRVVTQISRTPVTKSQIRVLPRQLSRDLDVKRDRLIRQIIKESTP